MRRFTQRALLLALFTGATATFLANGLRADDAKKVSGDLKKMQGSWVNAGEGPELSWIIGGTALKATVDGTEYVCTLKLDPKAEPIPSADIIVKEGPGDTSGKTSKAIYKFDGEKLIFCFSPPGGEVRPTEFKSTEEQSHLFEMKKGK